MFHFLNIVDISPSCLNIVLSVNSLGQPLTYKYSKVKITYLYLYSIVQHLFFMFLSTFLFVFGSKLFMACFHHALLLNLIPIMHRYIHSLPSVKSHLNRIECFAIWISSAHLLICSLGPDNTSLCLIV